MPNVPAVLAWLVVFVALPVNWIVVLLLWRLHRMQPQNRVLRDRCLVAVLVSMVVTVFAAVFLNNDMRPPPLSVPETQVITRLMILSLSIPAIYWLSLYRSRK